MKQQRIPRRLGWMLAGNDSPLRRPVDKLESAVITTIIVAFFIAAPLLAIFAAGAVRAAGTREMSAESQWKPRTAVLLQSAAEGAIDLGGDLDTAWVNAQWTAPTGTTKHGLVPVSLNARAWPARVCLGDAGRTAHPSAADEGRGGRADGSGGGRMPGRARSAADDCHRRDPGSGLPAPHGLLGPRVGGDRPAVVIASIEASSAGGRHASVGGGADRADRRGTASPG